MGDVNMVDAAGDTYSVPEEHIAAAQAKGWKVETTEGAIARSNQNIREEKYGGIGGTVRAGVAGTLRGFSSGLSDLLGDSEDLSELRKAHPIASGITEVGGALGGAVTGVGPAGWAARAGSAVARTAEGASAIARISAATAGGVLEGGILGAGAGVSELALSEDPVTWERAASALSSNVLFGAATGGVAGGLFKGAEIGLGKAKTMLDDVARARAAREALPEDLAAMDAKQLRAAEAAEKESLATSHKAELEGIEAGRVPQRQELADEIASFRRAVKDEKHFLTTKDVKLEAGEGTLSTGEIGAKARKANKALDNLLDDPKGLAAKPEVALKALRQHEHVLESTLARESELRAVFAADTSGVRAAALDSLPAALERNRALQAKIGELTAPLPIRPTTSPRLDAIAAARDALATPTAKSLPEQLLGTSVFGAVAGAVGALPIPGSSVAGAWLGAKASKYLTEKVFGGLARANGQLAARGSKAVGVFLNAAQKAAPIAPVLATKVLGGVRFAAGVDQAERKSKATKKGASRAPSSLPALYARRSAEIRSQTAYDETGRTVMRPAARAELGARLAPIRALAPTMADRIETIQARKIEYVASQLPRQPDIAGMALGQTKWQPSDMEMRRWARVVAAAEDPHGVVERLANGSITPEDAETMRAVYPELHAEITQQIVSQLPELRARLPYQRRLALSIFSGAPVDPAMDPRVLAVLQGQFAIEEGTAGGTEPPKAQPQFGSVRAEASTPAQRREEGAA